MESVVGHVRVSALATSAFDQKMPEPAGRIRDELNVTGAATIKAERLSSSLIRQLLSRGVGEYV
jgi:hypothetical protein